MVNFFQGFRPSVWCIMYVWSNQDLFAKSFSISAYAYSNNLAWLIVNFSQLASGNVMKSQTFKVTLLQFSNKTSRGADAQYRRFEVVFPQKLRQWSSVLDMYG